MTDVATQLDLPKPPADLAAGAPLRQGKRGPMRWTDNAVMVAYALARGCGKEAASRYAGVSHKTAWTYFTDPDFGALLVYVRRAVELDDERAFLEQESSLVRRGTVAMLDSLIGLMRGEAPGSASHAKPVKVSPMVSVLACKAFGELVGYEAAKKELAKLEADRVRRLEGLDDKPAASEASGKRQASRVIIDATLDD